MHYSIQFDNLLNIKEFLLEYFDNHYNRLDLEKDISFVTTQSKENNYVMESFAWYSDKIRYCRLTYLTSENAKIEMLNLAIYPNIDLKNQMFVTDFVFLNKSLRVGVIDIMPIFENLSIPSQEILHQKSISISPVYERKLEWSFDFLSPFACLATQTDEKNLKILYNLWHEYFILYQQTLDESKVSTPSEKIYATEFQNNYNEKHLVVELSRNPLKHFFGEKYAQHYFENFLFKKLF